MAPTNEDELLETARAAARAVSVSRRERRQRAEAERHRHSGTAYDLRSSFGHRLLSVAGIGDTELESMRAREGETVQSFRDEMLSAAAGFSGAGHDRTLRSRRHSPFAAAPELGYQIIQLDTATFIGPAVDQTGSNSRNLVMPAAPSPGRNFARAFLEIDSGHQTGFDVGHLNVQVVDFYFAFTAANDLQMNAASFVDWNGGYTEYAGWYPFDDTLAESMFTLGMDVYVVDPAGRLVGEFSATPDQGFDKRLDVGWFDFLGAYDAFTYSADSAFFLNGVPVRAGERVYLRVWSELDVGTRSVAYAQLDFASGNLGIDVTGVFAAIFPPVG